MPMAANNPAALKLRLAVYGVAAEAEHRPGETLEMILPDDSWARARVDPKSPIRLAESPGLNAINDGETESVVRLVPAPGFATKRNARGIPLGEIVAMRGTYATIALGGGCGLSVVGRTCALCRGRELTEKAGELWPVDEVVEAVRDAFDDGDAEFVHFVLGYFPGDDAGVATLRPYLEAIHRHFDTIVAVTMHPPADLRAIDLTYAAGVDVLSYNLEAADDPAMRRYFPGRARDVFLGRARYLAALAHAARILPSGAVWSELLLDLAPRPAVEAAIAELVGLNVMPLLGVSASLETPALEMTDAAASAAFLFDAVTRSGMSLNWLRDISTSLTALEARHFVAGGSQLPMLLHQLSRNRLGALTTRSLARLRRRLRVKRVRASFDSSSL
ncbi:MAG TPA: hypothetical protein VIX59_21285 [Candidatus Binataceae bacterium]